jgi:hypothetical protein
MVLYEFKHDKLAMAEQPIQFEPDWRDHGSELGEYFLNNRRSITQTLSSIVTSSQEAFESIEEVARYMPAIEDCLNQNSDSVVCYQAGEHFSILVSEHS